MGHGSMRAALAYQAVVGWIDMVLTIAAWPPGTSAARLVAGAGLRNSPAYLTDVDVCSRLGHRGGWIPCGMRTRINKATRSQRTANGLQTLISEMNASTSITAERAAAP